MDLKIWFMYLMTEVLVAITPGPAILLVSSQGLKYGAKASFFSSLGISAGNLVYFVLSACGIGTLILAAGDLFQYIKIGGAIYLIFSGMRMIYKSFYSNSVEKNVSVINQSFTKSFLQGFITEAANPKAIVFFVALIPLFINETQNMLAQFAAMGSTTIIVETLILLFYGWIAANGKKRISKNKQINKWQDRIAGSTLVGLGINLIFTKLGSN